MTNNIEISTTFFKALKYFYITNKKAIRRNYKDLTKKYLDYNDKKINKNAFLREPQFEALEIYVFLKEYLNNQPVCDMFQDWYEKKGKFANSINEYPEENKQIGIFEYKSEDYKDVYEKMLTYKENYANYIFALTMGLGKTILMATCIFYDFLLANKYPEDERFCHNVLVFAPDKTVLHSLKEIQTFDKSNVVPKEYVKTIDNNVKFHFLEEQGTTLNTLDNSDFNIIISNNQKIIIKKSHKEKNPIEKMFDTINIDNEIEDEKDLIFNQRFEKIARLSQLGIFVDEAHHLFGNQLSKELYEKKTTSLRTTINILCNRMNDKGSRIVACYNYTGTPYVGNDILPEVIYSYGLKESIQRGFLKDAEPQGFKNVKSEEFLKVVIEDFWNKYGEKRFEGMLPKLAIYGSEIREVEEEIVPTLEKILIDLNIPISKILINVGDSKITKDKEIYEFNHLDTVESDKQFIILVGKGKEGWNCRSLFGVALFRSPDSSIFVLQATMRCLRKITDIQQRASIYLSEENYNILDKELNKNFKMGVKDIMNKLNNNKKEYNIKVMPPPRYVKMKHISKKYNLVKKYNKNDILKLSLDTIDLEKYKIKKISKSSLTDDRKEKVISLDEYSTDLKYSEIMLYSELAMYIGEISCVEVKRILNNSDITINKLLEIVSQHNNIIYDILVPKIVKHIFEVEKENFTSEKEVLLLKEPEETYYTFKADPELVVTREDLQVMGYENKSFHADAYCFDSKPEKELFLQYIKNDKIKEIYFTGMFTANQTEFYIQYIDPDSKRLRKYYPDFIAKFVNDNYEIIEVKGDNKIDDENVKAKKEAAMEIAVESNMDYTIYKASTIMQYNVLDDNIQEQTEIKENIELSEKTIVDKIKEAKELLDMDIITYDEFEKIKIQLLKK